MTDLSSVRVVLLQARRSDDPQLEAERQLFAERLQLPGDRVSGWNLLEQTPDLNDLASADVVVIGGSGDYYVSNGEFPRQERLFDSMRELAASGKPVFASCFGFQVMTAALGGEVVHDPENMELGTCELELTAAGVGDPLFSLLPKNFLAQLGRKDRAIRLPEGIDNLASSALCPYQAFRFHDYPVWASQFHPELDAETNRNRYLVYLEGYSGYLDKEARQAILERFLPSPETEGLLRRFLELVTR